MNDKIMESLSLELLRNASQKLDLRTSIKSLEKIKKISDYLENYPSFLKKYEVKKFVESLKSKSISLSKIERMLDLIEKTDFSHMKREKTDFAWPEEILKKFPINMLDEIKEFLKDFESMIKDVEEVYQMGIDGTDVSDRKYADKLLCFISNAKENKEIWIDLIAKWCEESKEEYEQLLEQIEKEKVSMTLISLQNQEEGNYLPDKMEEFTYLDVSEKANYIRSLFQNDPYLAISLLDSDYIPVLTRICYDIELELTILGMDEDIDINLKEQLLKEKTFFKEYLDTILKEGKKYGKNRSNR